MKFPRCSSEVHTGCFVSRRERYLALPTSWRRLPFNWVPRELLALTKTSYLSRHWL